MTIKVTIDGREAEVNEGQTVLAAARTLGIDIPTLCHLERCGPTTSCLVCLVKINGRLVPSCATKAVSGMVVESGSAEVHTARRTALELLFSNHVGDCLSPCIRLCPLQLPIPVMIREIQSGKLDEAALTVRQALPLAAVLGRLCNHPCEQGCRRAPADGAAAIREMERFVADHDLERPGTRLLPSGPSSKKSIAIVGAGPTGLAAAHTLAFRGHLVSVIDRHQRAGGTLLAVPGHELPAEILAAEIEQIALLGVKFSLGLELGGTIMLEELLRDFDAVLLATGESGRSSATAMKAQADNCLTEVARVFAAGSAVKSVKLLVRAMAEGKGAAECILRFLEGEPVRRAPKPFSSIMGRIEPNELALFLQGADPRGRVEACNPPAGYDEQEAAGEASRCLRCDCRSAGNCGLQHYGQLYQIDASRFRTSRGSFEQVRQPGGVIFEPGKCILCGICVKLTEMNGEPLGLTFIGRGFDVHVAAPLNQTISDGLQRTAGECVEHCPTGALTFQDSETNAILDRLVPEK